MAVFGEIPFGQAVEQASEEALTADNLTELDAMIMNQLAGDDELLRLVSGRGPTCDVTGGNLHGVSLGDVLQARVDALNQQARYGGWSESQQYQLDFYRELLDNRRYTELIVSNAVDYTSTGISATNGKPYTSYLQMATFHLADGTCVPSFAGTGPEIDSWVEDGRMATTDTGVDAQKAAADYLNALMEQNPEAFFLPNGYSKGGNAALYAAIRSRDPERLLGVRNFDGPGFGDRLLSDPIFSEQYETLQRLLGDRLFCITPENSIVGHLMNDHPRYVYIDTDSTVFADHDYTKWNWQSDGSIQRAELRTELSQQVEAWMDGLIVRFSDEELDRFYDILSELALRYDLHNVEDLGKLGTDADGQFSLSALVTNLMDFWKQQTPQDQLLLKEILSELVTLDQLSMLAASAINDWLRSRGVENPLGTWLTAEAVENLLRGLIVGAVIVGAVYAAIQTCIAILEAIGTRIGETFQTLYAAVESAIGRVGEFAEQFFGRLKQWVMQLPEKFDLGALLENMGAGLVTGTQELARSIGAAGDWLKSAVTDLWERLRTGVEKAAVTVGDFLSELAKTGQQLVTKAFYRVGSVLFGWVCGWSGGVTLRIDPERLEQARRTTAAAAACSENLGPRLRALMGRLACEGILDSEQILHTFANLYNLSVASIVVDFHDDIDDMVRRVTEVQQQHDELKQSIRRQLAQLPG